LGISVVLADFVSDTLAAGTASNCSGSSTCHSKWTLLRSKAQKLLEKGENITRPAPLHGLERIRTFKSASDLCPECQDRLRGAIADKRGNVWDNLPVVFKLESWEKLRQKI